MERLKARRKILNRYAKRDDGKIIIDIAVEKIEDLYHDYDRSAPYKKKDLDPDLVEYIINSAEDVRDLPFLLQFRVNTLPDSDKIARVKQSVKNYFEYAEALEVRELFSMRRTSIIHFLIGIIFVIAYVTITPEEKEHSALLLHILTEGLIVAAWVSLWSAIDTFIVNWMPHRKKIRLYQKIARCEIAFDE